jgi:leucyl-tRNA synthetase
MMEFVNALYAYAPIDRERPAVVDEARLAEHLDTLVRLVGPIAPHLAEEMWSMLGRTPSVVDAEWPVYDPAVLRTEDVVIVIQVNGKVRDEMVVARDLPDDEVIRRAVAHGRIPQILDGKPIRKSIVVVNRLVSLVV